MLFRYLYITLFLVLCGLSDLLASHIVGGELQMIHQRGEVYLLRLILYYDQANAEFNLVDGSLEVGIFRQSNNSRVEQSILDVKTSTLVNYANPNCLPDSLKTLKITYEGLHRFPGDRYFDNEGYYMTWERCCRNNIISNVFQPGRQGMVFLLEFPSINTHPANSRPIFNEVPGEYICRDRFIELDYSATDLDGDSLAYFVGTPIAGFTSPDNPVSNLNSGPYPLLDNYFLMPGSPVLRIDSRTGILSVRPSQNGLFVFRIICNEYRNGIKIGSIHRDFQILVNECQDNLSPQTEILDQNSNIYIEGDTLLIDSREDLCFNINITDPDFESKMNYKIEPLNFDFKDVLFSPESGSISGNLDTLKVKMCWPDCLEPESGNLFKFYLIVMDNACPNLNMDTTQVTLKVIEEINTKPEITSEFESIQWSVGEPFSMWLNAIDSDINDSLNFSFSPMNAINSSQLNQLNVGNYIDGEFSFIANCGDFREESYNLMMYVKDNSCASNSTDSIPFSILINDFIPYEQNVTIPPNVITPNGDGLNEYFYFSQPEQNSCEFQEFKSVLIYNRWGIEVFKSNDRDFKWNANNLNSGEYFYLIQFNDSAYKGFIHVIK